MPLVTPPAITMSHSSDGACIDAVSVASVITSLRARLGEASMKRRLDHASGQLAKIRGNLKVQSGSGGWKFQKFGKQLTVASRAGLRQRTRKFFARQHWETPLSN